MIDINELRRLAQAAKNSCESVEWSHEFRSGRYSQGVIISGEENILIVCGANYGCWRDADDDGDSQFKALGDFVAAANPAAISELLDRLEAAESDAAHQKALANSALRVAEGWERKCGELRSKIARMEQQEPVWFIDERGEPKRYHKSKADYCKYGGLDLLYALPGAKGDEK